jgi:alginate O-acetyltransferase complex protein AlgI
MLVFVLSGLWHGAAWTFVAWGAWHGLFVVLEHAGALRGLTRHPVVGAAYMWAVMLFGWVFFRADSMAQAGSVIAAMLGLGQPLDLAAASELTSAEVLTALAAALAGSWGLGLRLVAAVNRWAETRRWGLPVWLGVRLAGCAAIFQLSSAAATIAAFSPFIYFRF